MPDAANVPSQLFHPITDRSRESTPAVPVEPEPSQVVWRRLVPPLGFVGPTWAYAAAATKATRAPAKVTTRASLLAVDMERASMRKWRCFGVRQHHA